MQLLGRELATLIATGLLGVGLFGAAPVTAGAADRPVAASAPSSARTVSPNVFERRILRRVNTRRENAGLNRVRRMSSCLDGFSERWARHLARSGVLVHRNQSNILGSCNPTWSGETLVKGSALTPASAVKAWMNSEGHRDVLMEPRANRAGVGVRRDAAGNTIGVVNFGDVN